MTIDKVKDVIQGLIIRHKPDGIGGSCNCDSCEYDRPVYAALSQALQIIDKYEEGGKSYEREFIAHELCKDKIASLESSLAEAKKCPWCGSTDLVCGKAWKEERDKLKSDLAELREVNKVANKMIGSNCDELQAIISKQASDLAESHDLNTAQAKRIGELIGALENIQLEVMGDNDVGSEYDRIYKITQVALERK